MSSNPIESVLLATLAEVFFELSKSANVESFSLRESFGRGASFDVETQVDGVKDVVAINVYPAMRQCTVVLQVNDQLHELCDSVEQLSIEVRSVLQKTRQFRRLQPN